MDNTNHTDINRILINCLLSIGLFSSSLSAQVIDGSHWMIKPGDSLYKIARTLYPESAKKQAQLRKALVQQNPNVFKNGTGNISVGDKLQLPDFAIQQPAPAAVVAAPVAASVIEPPQKMPVPKTAASQTEVPLPLSTPDPQDIVGQVIINIGNLTAQNRGATRELQRHSAIYRSDTLATGGHSHTQIRLKDGALLSLRPHTNIKIADYRYNGREDGSEKSIIELLKGGFRTITGVIGHLNKQNYQIRTSMATIGIRGTHYSLVLCQQASCSGNGNAVEDGLYGGVADGSIIIENQSGAHTFNNDQFFHLTSATALPVETLVPPHILNHDTGQKKNSREDNPENAEEKADKKQLADQAPDKKTKSKLRRLAVIFEPNQPNPVKKRIRLPKDIAAPPLSDFQPSIAPDGSAVIIGVNEVVGGFAAPVTINNQNNNVIILGPNRNPIAIAETYIDVELNRLVTNEFIAASATGTPIGVPSDLGRDTSLGVNWGRWNGEFTIREDGTAVDAQGNLHFIYSENMTSPAQLANLGGIKGNFVSYTSTGGTLPTDNQGNIGTSFAAITMNADFITQEITNFNINTSVTDTSGTNVSYSAGTLSPVPFDTPFLINSTAGCFGGPCNGEASVLFVGPQATGAISAYQINDIQAGTSITGTAVLTED